MVCVMARLNQSSVALRLDQKDAPRLMTIRSGFERTCRPAGSRQQSGRQAHKVVGAGLRPDWVQSMTCVLTLRRSLEATQATWWCPFPTIIRTRYLHPQQNAAPWHPSALAQQRPCLADVR